MPNKVGFKKGGRFKWNGSIYVVLAHLDNGKLRLEEVDFEEIHIVQQSELMTALENGELRFESRGKDPPRDVLGLESLTKKEREKVELRLKIIEPVKAVPRNELRKACQNLEEQMKRVEGLLSDPVPSYWTIERLVKAYQESGGNPLALATNYHRSGKPGVSRLDDEAERILQEVIDDFGQRPEDITVDTVHAEIYMRIEDHNADHPEKKLGCPSLETVRRRIKAQDPYYRDVKRYGEEVAYQTHGYKQKGPRGSRPLERVQIDHTQLNIFVVDPKTGQKYKPWLTVVIDTCTSEITGFCLSRDPPSYVSVMRALRHSVWSKDYVRTKYPRVQGTWGACGIPDVIVTDRGPDFMCWHFKRMCDELPTTQDANPAKKPWFKGQIEHEMWIIHLTLIGQLKGQAYDNVKKRAKLRIDPEKEAVLSLEDLDEILHIWIIDIRNRQFHRGIRAVPEKAWNDYWAHHTIPMPRSNDWVRLLGKWSDGTIQPSGIRFRYLDYNSRELGRLRRKLLTDPDEHLKREFVYDPDDIGSIRVYDKYNDEYLVVPCTEQEYASGLSEAAHKEIVEPMKEADRNNRHLRFAALRRIREVEAEAINKHGNRKQNRREPDVSQEIPVPVRVEDPRSSEPAEPETHKEPLGEKVVPIKHMNPYQVYAIDHREMGGAYGQSRKQTHKRRS